MQFLSIFNLVFFFVIVYVGMGCSDVIKFGIGAATAHGKARAKPCFVPGIFLG